MGNYENKALPSGFALSEGKYIIEKVLGSGGFGITYLAKWIQIQNTGLKSIKTGELTVVVKEFYHKGYCYRNKENNHVSIVNEDQQKEFDRLKRKLVSEASILNKFAHPNIVEVFDVFEENNTAYIVMAYIDGTDLEEKIKKQGILPIDIALKYTIQIAQALRLVHQHHILHLDISPSNILINRNDDALLIDFGISLSYDNEGDVKLTSKLLSGRKAGFSPPEQSSMETLKRFVPTIDIYALGATLYNCLSGKEPPEAFILLSGDETLTPLSGCNKDVSVSLQKIVSKAMSLNRKDRYQTADEFLVDLEKEIDKMGKKEKQRAKSSSATLMLETQGSIFNEKGKSQNESSESQSDDTLKKTEVLDMSRMKEPSNNFPKIIIDFFRKNWKTTGLYVFIIIAATVTIFLLPKPQKQTEISPPTTTDSLSQNEKVVVLSPIDTTVISSGKIETPKEIKNKKPDNPLTPDYYLDQGNRFFNSGEYAKAAESYKKCLDAGYLDKVSVNKRIKDSEKCLDILKTADSYFSKQEYKYAKDEYGRILSINPGNSYIKKQIELCDNQLNTEKIED